MVTLLQIGLTAFFGGTESVIRNQYSALDCSRVQYWFLNENEGKRLAYADDYVKRGARIFGLPGRRKHPIAHYVMMLLTLWKLRKEIDGVVVNANSYKHIIPLGVSCILGYKIRIFHSHTSGDYSGCRQSAVGRIVHCVQKQLVRLLSTDLFACSQNAGEWMFGERATWHMVPNAINAQRYAFNKVATRSGGPIIGMIGNFIYPKNHKFAVKLFVAIHRQMPAAKLYLAGTASEGSANEFLSDAERIAAENEVVESVNFLGHVEDVPGLLSKLDCLIMPSFFEGLPMVGLEAQASGLSCYFSDRVTREVQVNENCKFHSIDKGVDEWVDAILHQAKVDRVALSKHFAASKFNIKNSIEDLMAFYERKAGER